MVNKDLLLNGSGIKDTTAYDAIEAVQDLTGCVADNGKAKYLIINNSQNGMFLPVLKLREITPTDKDHPRWMMLIVAGRVFWTDTSMAEYGSHKGFKKARKLGIVSDEDMTLLKEKMADSLGIRVQVVQKIVERERNMRLLRWICTNSCTRICSTD